MTTINRITAKIDHALFTLYRIVKKSLHVHALAEKLFRKFQQISVPAMESVSWKVSFLRLVNVLWKITLPQLFFLKCNINQFKTLWISSPWKWDFINRWDLINGIFHGFFIHESEEIFPLMICKCTSYKCVSQGAFV